MSSHGSTRARVLHWFVRGGVAKLSDGRSFPIDVDAVVVGRDSGVNVSIEDPEVSAIHCELRAMDQGILVRDLGSTNGTFIGSTRVHEAVLTTPTEITLGGARITVEPSTKQRVDVGFADHFGPLVGTSPKMRRVFGILEKVAATPLSILLLGESGTGKELIAKAVHEQSPRKGKPFVTIDCGSIPPSLAEGLLFGTEKGAVPGATEGRKGALAEAHEGTLFLAELGELPVDLQPKLLRALSEKQVKRVGGTAFEPIDVRVVAATRRDLGAEMNAGRFRSDLYFRIAQVRIELPALRERLADLPYLVEDICRRVERAEQAPTVLAWVEQRMASHDWPGNVRELVNVVSVAATLADTPGAIDDVLTLARAPGEAGSEPATAFGEAKRMAIAAFERDYFVGLAKRARGNVSEMARQSGMERHHVRAYLRKYGVDRGIAERVSAERYLVEWESGGARLRLIEPTEGEVRDHARALANFYNEPVNRALLTNSQDFTPDDVCEQFTAMRGEGGRAFLLFRDDALMGDCDLRHIEERSAEYAILIGARADQARGAGTRFSGMLMGFAFGALGLTRVFASVRPENTGSLRMLEKLGYAIDTAPAARRFAEEDDDVCMSLGAGEFARGYGVALASMRVARRDPAEE